MARPRYFTPNEVVIHNTLDDLWVTLFGKVYDLTPLCNKHRGNPLLDPLLAAGGKDISNWFNPKTMNPKTFVSPVSNSINAFTPYGKFIDLSLAGISKDDENFSESEEIETKLEMSTDKEESEIPWWKFDKYVIGLLTSKIRKIRIVNMLLLKGITMEVCCEENIQEIQQRYLKYNAHAKSYTWRHQGKDMSMLATLEENNVKDISKDLERLKLNEDDFIPIIHLYFNDDLTVA